MNLLVLLATGFLAQSSANAGSEVLTRWSGPPAEQRCRMLRAVLEKPRDAPPRESLLTSECVKRVAAKNGKLQIAASIRRRSGPSTLTPPQELTSSDVCSWPEVTLSGPSGKARPGDVDQWILRVVFVPTEEEGRERFAFWAQTDPAWDIPEGQAVAPACLPIYGFVTLNDGRWEVQFDRSARDWVAPVPASFKGPRKGVRTSHPR